MNAILCEVCKKKILPITAEATGGICMRCLQTLAYIGFEEIFDFTVDSKLVEAYVAKSEHAVFMVPGSDWSGLEILLTPVRVLRAKDLIDLSGFQALFDAFLGGDLRLVFTAASFANIGAFRAYNCVLKGLSLFPESRLPLDYEAREEFLCKIPNHEWLAIDGYFNENPDDIIKMLAEYMRENKLHYLKYLAPSPIRG